LAQCCLDAGFPSFRVGQIWHWLYQHFVTDWDGMRNIPPALRAWLAENFYIMPLPEDVGESGAGPHKLLVQLHDGDSVEAVIIPSKSFSGESRSTVCISCQVGCRFNCAFCASGKAGLVRNLDAGEMVFQVVAAAAILGKRPSNVVFMGIGEPFDNYDAVIKAARIINHSDGLRIGARKITVSTSGIIPGIERFANEPEQFELSVSLHAPNTLLRSELMPINNRYPLPELMDACRMYTRLTNRIITFEYTLIDGVNDQDEHAFQLIKLLRKFPCRVNLIPLSPVAEFDGKPSQREQEFMEIMSNAHINTTLRNSQGATLKAACGQLRFAKRSHE
jgi:23S rRNA (adenine2503-C2)-methyltransferase